MQTALAAPWPQVGGGVEIEFETARGRLRSPLAECSTVRFECDCSPVRGFPSFRGQKNFPGLWWFSTTREHVGYESWLERDHLMAFDADTTVVGVVSQPFWFHWSDGRRHAPDYFVRLADGSAAVVDVRADDQIADADAALFDRSHDACVSVGWEYRRVGALDPVVSANLRWLSGYRHTRAHRPGIAAALEATFGCMRPLMEGARSVGHVIAVLPVLFHLLWHGRLVADLAAGVLAEHTMVGLAAPR
ncbi:TnsA-like heteromeric transposase endonuclease subunit [Mycobacterium nebraskense]|uniref:TnsA-like heteromeric transposase endonuclease subunit n=1 Tax=Mycobacterium nebraskense TaxID=244292 RepID=UPI000617C873|nr:TnsA-like heteromeric transposase endonuclease subunit [Mycobacterium nebraskense]KKC05013.1 TnsA endonuclease [Mycobacterium nebraskense]